MVNRRDFLRFGALAAAGTIPGLKLASAAPATHEYFGLHPFIENHPKAVFIRRTHVADKMDGPAKLREGLNLSRQIFVGMDQPGMPITQRIVLKPNATGVYDRARSAADVWGVGTDPQFYEGMVTGLKELGLNRFNFVESTGYDTWEIRGFNDVNERLGVDIGEPLRRPKHLRDGYGVTWAKVPDGVIFQRIPHYAPVGEPNTWILDIAKWKAHAMCLTQSVKNMQGTVVHPFTQFCGGWPSIQRDPTVTADVNPKVQPVVNSFFERHVKASFDRYDVTDGPHGGRQLNPMEQEIWAHKTCDNLSTVWPGLAMIEAIFGRDGDGFNIGNDHMANMVMFAKHPFLLDVIGLYLGGHEPGNVNLYRIAKERGLTPTFNPWEIQVFEWTDQGPVERKLADFPRTELKTIYLTRRGEARLHLVNDPFDYDKYKV
jgi:uncharacterized protein (DUF362 family)